MNVDAAGISGKVKAHYPGRSPHLPLRLLLPEGGGMDGEKSAEGILGLARVTEGPNIKPGRSFEFR